MFHSQDGRVVKEVLMLLSSDFAMICVSMNVSAAPTVVSFDFIMQFTYMARIARR